MEPKPLTSLELMITFTQKKALDQAPMHTDISSYRKRESLQCLPTAKGKRKLGDQPTRGECLSRQHLALATRGVHVSFRRDAGDTCFVSSVYCDIMATKCQCNDHRCHPNHHRLPSSTENTECGCPGNWSIVCRQSCAWDNSMRSRKKNRQQASGPEEQDAGVLQSLL